MSDGSSIEWTDATWTIAVGCTRISKGCDHCYAASFVHRGLHPTHQGLTVLRPKTASRPGVDWNGTVRTLPENLAQPLQWKKPRRVFVGSMTDLFHHAIPFEYVAAVFGVMAACPQHTFQVLTKRPARMLEFFCAMHGLENTELTVCRAGEHAGAVIWDARGSDAFRYDFLPLALAKRRPWVWPLPNVHLGVSVEDQATADERIPLLLQCPARVHWCSYEPALGPVDFATVVSATTARGQATQSYASSLSWIVVGGESGNGARPFDVAWARATVEAGSSSGARVFVKQLGARPHSGAAEHGLTLCTDSRSIWTFDDAQPDGPLLTYEMHDRKGKVMSEWPDDLRIREPAP